MSLAGKGAKMPPVDQIHLLSSYVLKDRHILI
jgi:hypothetical protein